VLAILVLASFAVVILSLTPLKSTRACNLPLMLSPKRIIIPVKEDLANYLAAIPKKIDAVSVIPMV